MVRRQLLFLFSSLGLGRAVFAAPESVAGAKIEPFRLSDAEWKKRLTPFQYRVLRQDRKSVV